MIITAEEWATSAVRVPPSEFVPTCKTVIPGNPMVPACTCPSEPLVVEGVAYDRISPSCLIHGPHMSGEVISVHDKPLHSLQYAQDALWFNVEG